MQNQYNFCSYLSQCHELWEQADLYVSRGQCEGLFYLSLVLTLSLNFLSPDFFIQLDQECGPLTLHSSLKDLVYYTRRGLRTLSASTSDEAASVAPPPFFHPPGPSEQDHKSVLKWWGGRIESQTMKEALWTWCPHSRQACLVMLPIRAYQDIMPEKGVLRLGANTTPFWTGDVTAMTRFCDN